MSPSSKIVPMPKRAATALTMPSRPVHWMIRRGEIMTHFRARRAVGGSLSAMNCFKYAIPQIDEAAFPSIMQRLPGQMKRRADAGRSLVHQAGNR
jgi:hypothetical protein